MTDGLALQKARQAYQQFINGMLTSEATCAETAPTASAPVQVNREEVFVCFLRIHPELMKYREDLAKMYPGAPVLPLAKAEWEKISG